MLKETEKNPGGQAEHKAYQSHDVTSTPKLSDIGVTRKQSSRWQGIASLPEKEFEEHIVARHYYIRVG